MHRDLTTHLIPNDPTESILFITKRLQTLTDQHRIILTQLEELKDTLITKVVQNIKEHQSPQNESKTQDIETGETDSPSTTIMPTISEQPKSENCGHATTTSTRPTEQRSQYRERINENRRKFGNTVLDNKPFYTQSTFQPRRRSETTSHSIEKSRQEYRN